MPSPYTSSPAIRVRSSGDPLIDALLGDSQWGQVPGAGVSLTYSFPWTTSSHAVFSGPLGQAYSSDAEHEAEFHFGLTAVQQASAREALLAWAAVANIRLQEVAETGSEVGDIRFAWTSVTAETDSGEAAWGWARYPNAYWPSAGDIWISTASSASTSADRWQVGSFNHYSLLHEIGHAIGLKHTFEGTMQLPVMMDNMAYTVMSYTQPANNVYPEWGWTGSGTGWVHDYIWPSSPMVLDIAAIQHLYGANLSYRAGDDRYTFAPDEPFFRTLWDAGGHDVLDLSNFRLAVDVDLQPGAYSSLRIEPPERRGGAVLTYDGANNLGIAHGALVEDAVGGSGNDRLSGNAFSNTLTGSGGNDFLDGREGLDWARLSGKRADYQLTHLGEGTFRLWDTVWLRDGIDTLVQVERLLFVDGALALDLDGAAGFVARVVGAVFGADAVRERPDYIGIGLHYLDAGMSREGLLQLALDARLGPAPGYAQLVDLLYTHVIGVPPAESVRQEYVLALQNGAFKPLELGFLAVLSNENQARIDLLGLASDGIAFVPFAG